MEYENKSEELSNARKEIAENIERLLQEELADLNMPSAKFKVFFNKEEKLSRNGKDIVEFLIATNVGQDYKTLVKIASGGEISRIMLALKAIFSKVDNIPILIFDEIDVGISGGTAEIVGRLLADLAQHVQILCITHQAQVAAQSDQHLLVKKRQTDPASSTILELEEEQKN